MVSYGELPSAPPEVIKPFKLVMQGLLVQGLDKYVRSILQFRLSETHKLINK